MTPLLAGELAAVQGLAPATTLIRLSLHVLAAAIWVGGQITLGGLVPTVRRAAPDALGAVARAFARLAWPAFAVLVATGVWNMAAVNGDDHTSAWKVVLMVKIAVVVASGLSAGIHQRARSKAALAFWGAASGLTTVAALVLGVALAG